MQYKLLLTFNTKVDENNLSVDVFHSLTYELCSTYARATTSVAVVPPSESVSPIFFTLANPGSLLCRSDRRKSPPAFAGCI